MKRFLIFLLLITYGVLVLANTSPQEQQNIQLLQGLFTQVSEKLSMRYFEDYYSPTFVLVSNNTSYSYETYKSQQANIFKQLKQLKVLQYEDIFAKDDKVVSRMSIKLTFKDNKSYIFYVILIALVKDGKIQNIWETTYPSWSDKLPTT